MSLAPTFLIITILSLVIFYLGTGRDRRIGFFLLIWTLVSGGAAYLGFFENTSAFPPRMFILFVAIVSMVVYLYRQVDKTVLDTRWLTSIHILRIPVELVLYGLFVAGQIPELMTFSGWNFDIVVGITAAILLIIMLAKPAMLSPRLLRVWHYFGIIMLTIIVTLAVLSIPSPLQQLAFEQPNRAVLSFPFNFLPAVVVPLVMLSHFLALKRK